jgi:hypothetical protein
MGAIGTVGPGELELVVLDLVDGSDMLAGIIGDFHVLTDAKLLEHEGFSCAGESICLSNGPLRRFVPAFGPAGKTARARLRQGGSGFPRPARSGLGP